MPSVCIPSINSHLTGFRCLRCSHSLPVADWFEGCPECHARGAPTSVRPELTDLPAHVSQPDKPGLWRYGEWLPYSQGIFLGEGSTSTIELPSLASELGLKAIGLKNEGQNPSGSHKDRMSCLVVTRAVDIGAGNIVAASSGNAGASVALYAAAAGLECSIICTSAVSPVFRRAIRMTGAQLLIVDAAAERWRLMAEMVAKGGWYPATNYLNPPVGSNPFGVDGLKTIAFELFEAGKLADLDAILVPTARGDLLWGLYYGCSQLRDAGLIQAIPRLYAVEPFARIKRVLDGCDPAGSFPGQTALFSIGGTTVTHQALSAIRASAGSAVVVADDAVARDQMTLAHHGCYLENASAAALTGLKLLMAQGDIKRGETIMLLATSHGYKEMPGPDDLQ